MLPRLRVLVSSAGAPGTYALIKNLEAVEERPIEVVACDAEDFSLLYSYSKFVRVPPANDPDYAHVVTSLIEAMDIDVFLPVSTYEVPVVAQHAFPCHVVVSSFESIDLALHKKRLYDVLVDYAPHRIYDIFPDSTDYILKSKAAKGGRGIFMVTANIQKRIHAAVNHKAQDMQYIDPYEGYILWSTGKFLACERLTGPHYDCMVLALDGDPLLVTCKTRERTRWGVITYGELINKPPLVEICKKVTRTLGLSYNFGIQFIGNTVIDVNPRVSTFIYGPDFNEPYLAIKLALGELTPDEVRAYQDKIPLGRKFIRYMDQVEH